MKSDKGGLRSAKMGEVHWEKKQKDIPVCGLKYATEFGNPADLDRLAAGLANFVKNHKEKW